MARSHWLLVLVIASCWAIPPRADGQSPAFMQVIDQLPKTRNSPLLATPEAAKLDEFTGGIGYRYPIEVPPGTGEATPSLELSYSSLTKNTEYGWGWSLNLSRIERSTRFGTPTYDSADDFELDGDLLVTDPSTTNRFHRERTRFEKIVFDPSTAGGGSWEVTQPDGTRLRYGMRDASTVNSRFFHPGKPAANGAFRWYLDEVIDPRGNSYQVDYSKVCEGSCASTPVIHVYPKEIRYSYRASGGGDPTDHAQGGVPLGRARYWL